MSRTILSIVVGATLLAVSTAHAGGPPPRPGFRPRSDAAIDLFNDGVAGLYNDVNLGGCPIDKVKQHLDALGKIEKATASLSDASDKAMVGDWSREMRGFLEAHTGVPRVGDWRAVDAALAAIRARPAFTLPDDLTKDATLDQVIDRAVQARRDADTVAAISGHASMKLYNCDDRGSGELARQFHAETAQLDTAVFQVEERLRHDRLMPLLALVRELGEYDVARWRHHAGWVETAITTVKVSRAIVAMEPRLAALEEFTGGAPTKDEPDAGTRPLAVLAVARQQLADLPPLITRRLAEVSFPKLTAKDKAFDKIAAKFVTGGDQIAFGPRYHAKRDSERFTEVDPVDHLTHVVVRERGGGYVAVKPATWSRPVPEGANPAELCELRSLDFYRYTKAGPSRETKKWLLNLAMGAPPYVAPILCTNAKRVTTLSM